MLERERKIELVREIEGQR
jgi:hypothetical protein